MLWSAEQKEPGLEIMGSKGGRKGFFDLHARLNCEKKGCIFFYRIKKILEDNILLFFSQLRNIQESLKYSKKLLVKTCILPSWREHLHSFRQFWLLVNCNFSIEVLPNLTIVLVVN